MLLISGLQDKEIIQWVLTKSQEFTLLAAEEDIIWRRRIWHTVAGLKTEGATWEGMQGAVAGLRKE